MVVAPLHLAEASGSVSVLTALPSRLMVVCFVETLPPLLILRRLLEASMSEKLNVPRWALIPEADAIGEEKSGGDAFMNFFLFFMYA